MNVRDMHQYLRFFRYFVFGLFLTCSAIIAVVSVWNLNLLQDALFPSSSLPLRTDAYLVFVGCAGLALIFPILFCELAQKSVFLVRVWFECLWVGLFCLMTLAGAAVASAAGSDELCAPVVWIAVAVDRNAICTSSRVLQAFTWISGLFLLSYFVALFMTTLIRRSDDDTIWHCNAGQFPWAGSQHSLGNGPSSPSGGLGEFEPKRNSRVPSIVAFLKRRSSKAPTIAAPRPRNAASEAIRRGLLSYRSGLSGDYSIEHFRPDVENPVPEIARGDRPLPPAPLTLASEPPSMVTRQATAVTFGRSLYPQHIQNAMPVSLPERRVPTLSSTPKLPPSPSPIGQWPRLNPPTPRSKRGTQAAGVAVRSVPPPISHSQPPRSIPERPLPTLDFESSGPVPILQSPSKSFDPSRTRPSGPR